MLDDGFAAAKLRRRSMMETFGRGCLYIILGVIAVMALAFIVGGTINIPWYILIPLIILAFWAASKKGK
jgi:uncharacterized membrane protein YdbT with pleckstrin-like domain